jgi:hypothetical protein
LRKGCRRKYLEEGRSKEGRKKQKAARKPYNGELHGWHSLTNIPRKIKRRAMDGRDRILAREPGG